MNGPPIKRARRYVDADTTLEPSETEPDDETDCKKKNTRKHGQHYLSYMIEVNYFVNCDV